MFSYFEPNFIEKFFWESVFFFKFWPKSKWRETKIGYLAAILRRYNIFIFFFRIVIFYSPYMHGANFIATFRWESGFLTGGSMEPLLGTSNGSKSTLVT